ncbi:Ig-like domain-containing protein [Pseudomonas alliivorans]|nr:Ig-like domain-containing protein [Pseudomonas alliivorans]MEE4653481.1 Ig-like domain-containing protein [Pseudomonas alliivorans]MEE4999626.1 Ig-like domain-containing protein [Pseudomonas alliivorans]
MTDNLALNMDTPALEAPNIPVALDNGVIPIAYLDKPLIVELKVWPGAMPGYTYQLYFDQTLIGPRKIILESHKPDDILTLEIPSGLLLEGHHAVAYEIENPVNMVTEQSLETGITIDRVRPGSPVLAPILFPKQVQDGLTSDELNGMGDVLSGTVASYKGMEEGDVIRTYWNDVPGPMAVVTRDDMGLKRVMVDFVRPFLELIGDIEAPVYYTVTDVAGNLSMNSEPLAVKLQLFAETPLPTPTVKQATGDTLDPANAPNGATVVIDASASFKAGDRVTVQWMGPKGSDTKEKTLIDSEAGQPLETVFASALVVANAGQVVDVFYTVNRANGLVQTSATLALKVLAGLTKLPAPRMDTVGHDGVVRPSLIPDSGATVRVSYPGMSGEDSVVLNWRGLSSHDTSAKPATGNELQFNVPKAWIIASQGGSASVTYTVSRDSVSKGSVPLWLTVEKELVFDTSPVTLAGKVYLIPSVPDLLPSLPAGTSVRRQASGGQAPYRYTSSNPLVAKVDGNGLTTVRGNGTATISVTDASGTSKSYQVTVTKVIHCLGLGSGSLSQMSSAASAKGGRIPSINELKEIYATYGNRWPLGNGKYWSSTVAAVNLVGWKWYFVKNLVTGADFKLLHHNASLGVAIR